MIYRISRFLCAVLSRIFFPITVRGAEHVPRQGGFILASNHVSYLDPVVLGVCCPRRLNYMAREDLFRVPVLGWLLPRYRVFPVKRDSADFSAIREAIRRVNAGEGLLLFPEGTRVPAGESRDPEPGIGFLAAKLNVPVVPVFVSGTERALPKDAKMLRYAPVTAVFGEPFTLQKGVHRAQGAQRIMDAVRKLTVR